MARYPALIDGANGAYGVVFPDLPGIVAMGTTVEEAMLNAEAALQDAALEFERDGLALNAPSALEDVEVPAGSALSSILLVRAAPTRRSVRLNLTLDAAIADIIRLEAERRGMSRKRYVEWMTRRVAQIGG
jgi:predicted RNase H-like HicB family nuclease